MYSMKLGENSVQVMNGYNEKVNEHYKEQVIRLFDDVTALLLEPMVSDESESDVEVDIGK